MGSVRGVLIPASNLGDGDVNGARDVFVRDVVEGRTVRVSIASDGTLPNQHPRGVPRISVDGRFIVFSSAASNFVAGDTNAISDVFVVGGVSVATPDETLKTIRIVYHLNGLGKKGVVHTED